MSSNENFGALRDERVRCLSENPDVATPNEIRRLAQEAIDRRTAHGLNRHVIEEQSAEIAALRKRVEALASIVARGVIESVGGSLLEAQP